MARAPLRCENLPKLHNDIFGFFPFSRRGLVLRIMEQNYPRRGLLHGSTPNYVKKTIAATPLLLDNSGKQMFTSG